MAGEWIKLEKSTPDKPEVFAVSRMCKVSHGDAFLAIMRLFIWADSATEDGIIRFFSASDADKIGNLCGLGDALLRTGWISISGDDMVFCKWERHNGASSKRRALDCERKSAKAPRKFRIESGKTAEVLRSREEKSRVEKKECITPLPPEVPSDIFEMFVQHRKQMKKSMTEHAKTLLAKHLCQYDTETIKAMLEEAMERGWQNPVWEKWVKKENNTPSQPDLQPQQPKKQMTPEEYKRAMLEGAGYSV